MASLPGYYEAADPAKYFSEGARIASERAARTAQAQERSQAADHAEAELRLRQQEIEAKATQAAQKYAAQREYQQAIASGQDPVQAILKYGPAMGEGTDAGIALRASQPRQQKPPAAPPAFQTIAGPDGKPMKVLMQGGKIVPPGQYMPKPPPAAPEQWKDTTRKISGKDIPGQVSTKTGMFRPYPASEQAGAVSQQARVQIAQANRKKAELTKVLGDETQLLSLAKKRAGGKQPTHADLEAVQADFQKQADDLDQRIDSLTSGGETASEQPKTLKFTRDKEGKLVLSQ